LLELMAAHDLVHRRQIERIKSGRAAASYQVRDSG